MTTNRALRALWPLLLAPPLLLGPGCQYEAATDACYAVAMGIGDRLFECGHVPSPEAGEQAIHDELAAMGFTCDMSPTGIRDEDELYMECLPQLMEYDCEAILRSVPPPCEEQIVYRGR